MVDRTVAVKLDLNISGLVAKGATAAKALAQIGGKGLDWVGRNEQHINQLSNTVGKLGLAAVVGVGLAVKKFADFDQAMSHVAATGDDARGSIDALRQAAIDAGADTVFSATEAAGAIEALAKAGVSAEDILAGGLDGALDLAAAGGLEVAEAAEIAATAMAQFGLSGDDVVHVADLLAAAAGKAQGDVSDMGMALKQSGLVAEQTGLSIEETTAGLAAFAEKGLLGSDAGTSFKSMLQRLTPQSKEAADEMDRLGISAFDSQGQFIGLAEFAGNLQTALHDLTPEQRNAAMAVIFGSDAVRAANVLYGQGEQGIRDWITAVDDQGFAAETAATRLDNLRGDIEAFLGSLETAFIGAGEGANGPLRDLVQSATDAVNAFNDMPKSAQSATLAIVGGGGLVALGVAGLGKLIIGVSNTRDALKGMGVEVGNVRGKVRGLVGAAAGIGAALAVSDLIQDWTGFKVAVEELGTEVERLNLRDELGPELEQIFGEDLKDAADVVHDFNGTIAGLARSMTDVDWKQTRDGIKGLDDTLAGMVRGGQIEEAATFWQRLTDAVREQGGSVLELQETFPQLGDAFLDAAHKSAEAGDAAFGLKGGIEGATGAAEAGGAAQEQLGEDFDATTEGIQTQTEALMNLVEQMQAAGLLALSVRDAERNLQAAVDDATSALDENGSTLDITTEKGRDNQAALDDIASSTHDLIGAMAEQGAEERDLQAVMTDSRGQFIKTATQMGLTEAQASALADELGLIPGNYEATVSAKDNASGTINGVQAQLRRLDGQTSTVIIERIQRTIHEDWFRGSGVPGGLAAGGYIPGYADGGKFQMFPQGIIGGPGTGTSDSVLARVSQGEFVVKAAAVQRYGVAMFQALNDLRVPPVTALGSTGLGRARTSGAAHKLEDAISDAGTGVQGYAETVDDDRDALLRDGWQGLAGDHLRALFAPMDRAAAAFDRLADDTSKAADGIKSPNRGAKPGLTLLQRAAKEMLAAIQRNGRIAEDFTFKGMSDMFNSDTGVRGTLLDLFYKANPGFDFGPAGTRDAIEKWLLSLLGSARSAQATAAPMASMASMPVSPTLQSTVTLNPSTLATALDGMAMTLMVDGRPMRGVMRAEIDQRDKAFKRAARSGAARVGAGL